MASQLHVIFKMVDKLQYDQTILLLEHISRSLKSIQPKNVSSSVNEQDCQVTIIINEEFTRKQPIKKFKSRPKYTRNNNKLITSHGHHPLDCTLDELIELNVTKQEIFNSKVEDWVSENGDRECPKDWKLEFQHEIKRDYPRAKGKFPTF